MYASEQTPQGHATSLVAYLEYSELERPLVAKALPGMDPVHKISIIPSGIAALGYTIQRPTEDRFLMTRQELEYKMAVLYGGGAAETVVCDEVSTGAAVDLQKITDIARAMVQRYGMEDKLGQVVFERQRHSLLGGRACPISGRGTIAKRPPGRLKDHGTEHRAQGESGGAGRGRGLLAGQFGPGRSLRCSSFTRI